MIRRVFIVSLLICTVLSVYSQRVSNNIAQMGFKYMAKQKFRSAEKIFNSLIEQNPQSVDAQYGLASLYATPAYRDNDYFMAYHFAKNAEKYLLDVDTAKTETDINSINTLKDNIEQKLVVHIGQQKRLKLAEKFLDECKGSPYTDAVVGLKRVFRISHEFDSIVAINTVMAFERFIDKYPDAQEIPRAIELRNAAAFITAQKINTIEGYNDFMIRYRGATEIQQATNLRNALAYEAVKT